MPDVYILQICTRWGEMVVLSYVDNFVYWYTYKALGKWFLDTLGKRFNVNFLIFAHWFIPIRISQLKDNSISVYQDRCATYVVDKYLDTSTFKTSTNFYKTTLSYDMIFTNYDLPNSDEKVEKLTRGLKIHYRACIGSLIYLLSTRVYLSFAVHKS